MEIEELGKLLNRLEPLELILKQNLMKHKNFDTDYTKDKIEGYGNKASFLETQHKILDDIILNAFSNDSNDLDENKVLITKQPRFTHVPFHQHDYLEIIYVFQGACRLYIEDQTNEIQLTQGQLCFINPETTHALGILGAGDIVLNIAITSSFQDTVYTAMVYSNDHADQSFINEWFYQKHFQKYMVMNVASKKSQHTLEVILMEYYGGDLLKDDKIKCLFIIFFSELEKLHQDSLQESEVGIISERMNDILEYIWKNIKTVKLADVAKEFGYHPAYVSQMIYEKTNRSFGEWVVDTRLKIACGMLVFRKIAIHKVAAEVGYKNPDQFNKVFKEKYGISPEIYRKTKGMSNGDLTRYVEEAIIYKDRANIIGQP
ncbi:AraC family transcriptional regulator [Alkaliphilus crotonatoxidans]